MIGVLQHLLEPVLQKLLDSRYLLFKMNSAQLLSELSKFSADMRLADNKVYFDSIIVKKNSIIFDHRGDQQSITVAEAIEILTQNPTKSIWFMSDCSEFPATYINKAEFEGESYVRLHSDY